MYSERYIALERSMAIFVPLAFLLAGQGIAKHKNIRRTIAATVLGLLWCLFSLLLLQRVNLYAEWWEFSSHAGLSILTMSFELWFGWAMLWGAMPTLCFPGTTVRTLIIWFTVADVLTMPFLYPALVLHRNWLLGEAMALLFVSLPSLVLQRLTLLHRNVKLRALLQVITAAGVFLYLPAEIVFAVYDGPGWSAYEAWPPITRQILVQCGLLLALPGVAAVQEFASRGEGTPLPYDPPKRLVTTGMYRYVANPMQLSCFLTLLLWALLLRSWWLLIGPAVCIVYSAGIAQWDESVDLQARFGEAWSEYRAEVRAWLPQWRPYVSEDRAVLYIARDCTACSAVRRFLEKRNPLGITILHAEDLPLMSITRMRYICGAEAVEGVHAMGRALEHLHLGWAIAGVAIRLPLVWWVTQMVLDVSGMGPRVRTCSLTKHGAASLRQ